MNWNYHTHFERWVKHKTWLSKIYDYRSPIIHEDGSYQVQDPRTGELVVMMGITDLISFYIVTKEPLPLSDHDGFKTLPGRRRSKVKKEPSSSNRGMYNSKKTHISIQAIVLPGVGRVDVVTPNGRPRKELPPVLQLRGAKRGTLVHRQIEDFVYCESLEAMRRKPANHIGIHYFAPLLLLRMVALRTRPLLSEFRTHDASIGCATKVDTIGIDEYGRLVFFENKTGYSNGKFTKLSRERWLCPALAERAARFPCTPRNKAVVQVVLGAAMTMRMLNIPAHMIRAIVLRVDEYGVCDEEVNADFFRALTIILYEYLTPIVANVRATAERRRRHEIDMLAIEKRRKKTTTTTGRKKKDAMLIL